MVSSSEIKECFDLRTMEDCILKETKALIDSFKFHMIYCSKISEKKAKQTTKMVKSYREKAWKIALEKCNGNKEEAYKYYVSHTIIV